MTSYIIRRLLLMVPTLLLVTILIFGVSRMIPGSVIDLMVAEMASFSSVDVAITAEQIRKQLGMDVPVHVQYGRWMGGVLTGDLGKSLWTDRSINEELAKRLPVSLELGLMALIIGLTIAIPVGVYSAIRQDTAGDYVGRTFAILNIAVPSFWLGTMVVVYPSVWWGISPPIEYIPLVKDPLGNLAMFLLPAFILGMGLSGGLMRMTRTMMLEVLRQDYIRTAWAKGLSERTIIFRHALRNALIPVITIVGILLQFLVAGSVIVEMIFALPGLGLYLIEALNTRDYNIISGINLVVASFILIINLLIDLSYAFLDPRVVYK